MPLRYCHTHKLTPILRRSFILPFASDKERNKTSDYFIAFTQVLNKAPVFIAPLKSYFCSFNFKAWEKIS